MVTDIAAAKVTRAELAEKVLLAISAWYLPEDKQWVEITVPRELLKDWAARLFSGEIPTLHADLAGWKGAYPPYSRYTSMHVSVASETEEETA